MSMAAAIGLGRVGCGGVGCVVGAEALSESAGVWFKTRFYREGDFLCATVYSVAAGEPRIVELRVDLRPIARAVMRAHLALHENAADKAGLRGQPLGGATVGWSLGKLWRGAKKAAKAIGRSKLVQGVVHVTSAIAKGAKAVIKSKAFGAVLSVAAVFPLTAPFAAPALGAYAAANAAVSSVEAGAKVVKTAKSVVGTLRRGKALARQVATTKASATAAVRTASAALTPAARASIATRAQAAGRIQLNAQGQHAVATSLARAPAGAARSQAATAIASRFKALAELRKRSVLAQSLPGQAGAAVAASTRVEMAAAPGIARAATMSKRLSDPKVQAQLTAIRTRATKAESLLEGVKAAAATGSLDAQKSAVIVNLVARNRARIQAMSQANAGGLPGVLITKEGKLVRGRFRVQASSSANGVLYQGPGKPGERGAFATVAGIEGCYSVGAFSALTGAAVNGDLPLDGVRMMGPSANASELGSYEVEGCGGNCGCAPCSSARS